MKDPLSFDLREDLQRLLEARHHDPFSVLGRFDADGGALVRAFLPHAVEACLVEGGRPLSRLGTSDFLVLRGFA